MIEEVYRRAHMAANVLLREREGRRASTGRQGLPLFAHLLVRHGPLSEAVGRDLLHAYLKVHNARISGPADRSLFTREQVRYAVQQGLRVERAIGEHLPEDAALPEEPRR